MVGYELAKKEAAYNPEYRRATEGEKTLMLNAERFMLAMPYKNKWELENQQALGEKRKLQSALGKLQDDFAKLDENLRNSVDEKKELETTLAKARSDLDYVWNKLVSFLSHPNP